MQTSSLLFSGGAGSGAQAPGGIASAASATSDMFTRLLVAQIRNQDPTAPTDPSTYVNQLTQLSQTESLQNMARLTNANASVLQSMQVLALGAQVGSSITVSSSSVKLGDTAVQGSFTQGNTSANTNLVITGSDNRKVTVPLGPQPVGDVPFSIDPTALGLAPGTYTLAVETSSGETPATQIVGALRSVKLSPSGGVVITVDHLGVVDPSAITSFNGNTAPN